MYDLNDARVDALRVATDAGLDVATFNRIWRIIVPAAIKSPRAAAYRVREGESDG